MLKKQCNIWRDPCERVPVAVAVVLKDYEFKRRNFSEWIIPNKLYQSYIIAH